MRMDALLRCLSRWMCVCIGVIVLSTATPGFAEEKSTSTPGSTAITPGAPGATPGFPALIPGMSVSEPAAAPSAGSPNLLQMTDLSKRENFSSAMQLVILLTVLSLAPAILIMMTSFTRIIIVLSLLRQALGTQQLPPNQVLVGLAMFMTFLIMGPTWQKVNNDALRPYMNGTVSQGDALVRAQAPVRDFMIKQIRRSGNDSDVDLFTDFAQQPRAQTWSEVGTVSLIPAFMLSELKTAFIQGFKVYLPFLIIDMVISTVLISMGMMMLPPAMISLPFKLLLFVLADGWHLITFNLMDSFAK